MIVSLREDFTSLRATPKGTGSLSLLIQYIKVIMKSIKGIVPFILIGFAVNTTSENYQIPR
jgi:hypothetical protein